MRGTVSSLALILALSSGVAIAAPKSAVSESTVGNAAVNDLEGASASNLNVERASSGCKIHGPCSVLSPPDTCCGSCILIDSAIVSQDMFITSADSCEPIFL